MNILLKINSLLYSFLWGPVMLAVFLSVGIYFHVRTGFLPITRIRLWLKKTLFSLFDKKTHASGKNSLSSFEALFAALAGSMGTGNITGVATAIVAGGPGAVFWMWISAVVGMMTKFAENVLGMLYRKRNLDGSFYGSPMIYMAEGLRCRPLAVLFALFCVLASFGLGNMTQGNSVATALYDSLNIPPFICGVVLAGTVSLVTMGGVKRIGKFTSYLIPIVSVIYLVGAFAILFVNAGKLPGVFSMIFEEAFRPAAIGGGALGYGVKKAMQLGISRGIFSNEAGLGSSVMVYSSAAAGTKAFDQGLWGIFEVFLDTIVVCTITALVILCSGVYDMKLYETALIHGTPVINGSVLASNAFMTLFGKFGAYFISFSMAIYAFATLLTWSHYGAMSCSYLFGQKSVTLYKYAFLIVIVIGCMTKLELIWSISDTFNCLMAIPNLIALMLLSGKVVAVYKKEFRR